MIGPISGRVADRGQAVVETAVALPMLVLVLLGVLQVAVVAVHQVEVMNVARSAARAASVSADPTIIAASAVTRSLPRAAVTTSVDDDVVSVEVRMSDPTDVPMIGTLLPSVDLVGRATMLLEPPP